MTFSDDLDPYDNFPCDNLPWWLLVPFWIVGLIALVLLVWGVWIRCYG